MLFVMALACLGLAVTTPSWAWAVGATVFLSVGLFALRLLIAEDGIELAFSKSGVVKFLAAAAIFAAIMFLPKQITMYLDDPQDTETYKKFCHGAPLDSAEKRNEAMEQGYGIHPSFGCITKDSFAAMEQEKARRAAAKRPASY